MLLCVRKLEERYVIAPMYVTRLRLFDLLSNVGMYIWSVDYIQRLLTVTCSNEDIVHGIATSKKGKFFCRWTHFSSLTDWIRSGHWLGSTVTITTCLVRLSVHASKTTQCLFIYVSFYPRPPPDRNQRTSADVQSRSCTYNSTTSIRKSAIVTDV
jgi:hypothetical protein